MNKKLMIVIGSFAAAFVLLSYLGWSMLIKPVDARIAAKNAEKEGVETKLRDAKSKAAQYDKFKAQAENIRRDLNLISMRLDPDFSVREFQRLKARLYAHSEILVSKLTSSSKRERSKEPGLTGHDVLPITVEFESGFHDIGQTLATLIQGVRLLVPHTLDFKPGTGGEGGGAKGALWEKSVKGTLVLNLYVEPMGAAK